MFVVKHMNRSDNSRRDSERLAQLKSVAVLPEKEAFARSVVGALSNQDERIRQTVMGVVERLASDELRYVRTLESPAKSLADFYESQAVRINDYAQFLLRLIANVLGEIPHQDREVGVLYIDVPLLSLVKDGGRLVQQIVECVVERNFEGEEFHLGAKCADRVIRSMCQVSGMTKEQAGEKPNRVKWPKPC